MKKGKKAPAGQPGIWIVRAVAFLIVLVILSVAARAWFKSTFSCVQAFESMEYEDPDEQARFLPWYTPSPMPELFSDSAYDMAYPDLVEPTLSP